MRVVDIYDTRTIEQSILTLVRFKHIVSTSNEVDFGTKPIFELYNFKFKIADIIFIVGGLSTYYEMIRLQIGLFKRLSIKDNESK